MKAYYFANKTCRTCKGLWPKVEGLMDEYNVELEYVDVEEKPEISGQMLVFSVPTLVFVDEDNRELNRFYRNFGMQEVRNFIERYISIMNS
ncbi:glutaredoxin [Marinitoga sp. 1197]|uniref:thioredoxin family protein n=1 Tax=unclassified Marinitoga TaxID=2640159 RepID=UPI00064120C7|nr:MULTISPECIES: thioredoxin family protein [unclassified Marinitoga]KLO21091.1 glutaredoxin [Marinitoga sp. 1197]KLO24571.1 glutaredoxin [Marinitoga sp. 1155]NUU98905.1 glutaredoxin [Marinitoga sp. 1154]